MKAEIKIICENDFEIKKVSDFLMSLDNKGGDDAKTPFEPKDEVPKNNPFNLDNL